MICKNCKKEISVDDEFCPYCGKKIKHSSISSTTKTVIAIIAVAAVVAAGLITATAVMSSKNPQKTSTSNGALQLSNTTETVVLKKSSDKSDKKDAKPKTTSKQSKTEKETKKETKKTKKTEIKLKSPSLGDFYDSTDYSAGGDGVTVKSEWKAVDGADGYEYHCEQTEEGSNEPYIEDKKTTKLYYETGASVGLNVTLKVRAYKKTSSGTVYSDWSKTITCEINTEQDTETEANTDYKQAYEDILNDLSYEYADAVYTLYDMNGDGIPELIFKYGTCEADYQVAIYSYINGEAEEVGDNFSGFNNGFYKDNDSGEFCLIMHHMQAASITYYTFDGSTVTESEPIEFSNDYDSENNYGSFSQLASTTIDDFSLFDNY